jgi:RecA-family ATPase
MKYISRTDAKQLIDQYGFAVFPVHGIVSGKCTCGNEACANPGKHPATNNGLKDATKDIDTLVGLFAKRRGLNLAIATGEMSGVFVVDIDGPEGAKDWDEFVAGRELPPTLTSITARGKHLFFKHPGFAVKTRTRVIGSKIDIRGDGGYVVSPGSNHASGHHYIWADDQAVVLDAPDWVLERVKEPIVTQRTAQPILAPVFPQRTTLGLGRRSEDEMAEILSYIDPDCSYDDWIKVGMALHDDGYPFSIWDNWSKKGSKYPKETPYNHWKSFHPGGGVSMGSVVQMAKDRGYRPVNDATAILNKPSIFNKAPALVDNIDVLKGDTLEGETVAPLGPTIKATSIDDIDLDHIPPREFLYADILARKYVSMVIAPPGAGKSILSMQIGLSAASGKPWGEWSSKIKGLNVWVYNNEEGSDELTRRIKGVMMHNHISKDDISGKFYVDSGEHQSINVAKAQGETVVFTDDYIAMLTEIINRKIDILIVDPFAEMHSVAENSNDGMKVVTALFRKIAFDANCAVLLIHHAKKWAEGMAGNADSGRGGGAQIGVVRRAFTLAKMSEDEAKKMGVPNDRRHWYVRFDDAKSNITAPAEKTVWMKFKSINILNGSGLYPEGDSVGGIGPHIS